QRGTCQVKWWQEAPSSRSLQRQDYRRVARMLDAKRFEREHRVEATRARLERELHELGVAAQVHGRPKHLYCIWKKMQGKELSFEHVYDVRALRVIVDDVPACYAVLSHVHELYRPV